MNRIHLEDLHFRGQGVIAPPHDMTEAARLSLSEAAFSDLMNQTGHQPPTSAQLCAAVHLERTAS